MGGFEGHPRDPGYLIFIVFQTFSHKASTALGDAGFFVAKIQAADKFTDDNKVNAVSNDFRLQGRKMRNILWQVYRAEVRESVVPTAQGQQSAALRLHINGDLLRPS